MAQILIDLDERTIERLNKIASPTARKRSEFIRTAIRRALDERAEAEMEEAYRRVPQDSDEVDLDPETWEPVHFGRRKRSGQ